MQGSDQPVRGIGVVAGKVINRGSKSERVAVEIRTDEGTFRVCRKGGNPLSDPVLQRLVGQEIRFEGRLVDGVLVLEKWSRNG